MKSISIYSVLAAASLMPLCSAPALAQAVSVFAKGTTVNATGPNSITNGAGSIWVSYAGGTTADGTEPAGDSTVVRYAPDGTIQRTYLIHGSVDGLKYNPYTTDVWALQNQDANSRLTLINTATNALTPVSYAVVSATQGYDDVVFKPGQTFLSYTNPASLTDATIQQITSASGAAPITVRDVLTGAALGTNLNTGQTSQPLPNAPGDPDSLKLTPTGDLMQTSGNRDALIFVHDAGLASQTVSFLHLTSPAGAAVTGLDDAVFASASAGTFYLTETGANNQVLKIHADGLTVGGLYGNVGSLNELGLINQQTGVVTSFVNGLTGPHGLSFVADAAAVPEPATWAMMLAGFTVVGSQMRRRTRRFSVIA